MRGRTVALLEAAFPEGDVEEALALWEKRLLDVASRLDEEGALWLVARHGARGGQLVAWPYLLAERAKRGGLRLKNVLARHDAFPTPDGKAFSSAHELVLFLVPSLQRYRFDKAPLREPHVWKDLEWGRRTVGVTGYHDRARTSARYPEGGRDPGNVLARAERDAAGHVLALRPYPRDEMLTKLALASSDEGWTVLTNVALDAPGRKVERAPW